MCVAKKKGGEAEEGDIMRRPSQHQLRRRSRQKLTPPASSLFTLVKRDTSKQTCSLSSKEGHSASFYGSKEGNADNMRVAKKRRGDREGEGGEEGDLVRRPGQHQLRRRPRQKLKLPAPVSMHLS